jgi:hypothetical protein
MTIRKVADASVLRSPSLRRFLSESQDHRVVLTDYSAMESYKGDTLQTIYHSMEVLRDYPYQVDVLKTTGEVCALSGRSRGLQRRLIDHPQSRQFPTYCQRLLQAHGGNVELESQILQMGRDAKAHLQQMKNDLRGMAETLKLVAAQFSPTELEGIRRGGAISKEPLRTKFGRFALSLTSQLFASHPRVKKLPTSSEVTGTYVFRFALCVALWAVDRIRIGSLPANPDRLLNDIVDLNYPAYATLFDGLISADARMLALHARCLAWVRDFKSRWK